MIWYDSLLMFQAGLRHQFDRTLASVLVASTTSRIRGALYGTVVVDALGGPLDFHGRDTFTPVTSYRFNA